MEEGNSGGVAAESWVASDGVAVAVIGADRHGDGGGVGGV